MPSASAVAWRFQWLASSTSRMICRSGAFQGLLERLRPTGSIDIGPAAITCGGQILDADHVPLPKQHRPFDHVLQLADVARPAVALQRGQRLVGEAVDVLVRRPRRRPSRKCSASSGMSEIRSRSGGNSMLITLMR